MKIFKIIRKLSIYSFCILGWGIIYYILLEMALNGGSIELIECCNELWIELIIVPILVIILIIFIALEVKE